MILLMRYGDRKVLPPLHPTGSHNQYIPSTTTAGVDDACSILVLCSFCTSQYLLEAPRLACTKFT